MKHTTKIWLALGICGTVIAMSFVLRPTSGQIDESAALPIAPTLFEFSSGPAQSRTTTKIAINDNNIVISIHYGRKCITGGEPQKKESKILLSSIGTISISENLERSDLSTITLSPLELSVLSLFEDPGLAIERSAVDCSGKPYFPPDISRAYIFAPTDLATQIAQEIRNRKAR